LSPELTQAVLVGLALDTQGVKRIAIPVTTSSPVVERIRSAGAEILWTKTEHHAMMASATAADFAVGTRGEVIYPGFLPAYDGMFAAAKLLEALARSGTPLRELADAYRQIHVLQERVACPWGRKGQVMRRLMEATEGEQRDLVDGVKIWKSERDWVLIIPHSHKPYFVVTAEGPDAQSARTLLRQYSRQVELWRDSR
jgi:mannose-1-phosphate guanylyltransferase/phosphomannomutase